MKNIEYKDDISTLVCNSFDSTQKKELPLGVYFPKTSQELAYIVKELATAQKKFLIRAAGSGFVGGVVPGKKCYVISVEKMNKVLSVNKTTKRATVECGIVNGELNAILKKENLTFTPDPASKDFSSVGGNISNNSGGLNTRKFGVTRESVRGLKLITPNGDIILTGEMHPNNENLIIQHLAIGSEGTLYVIAEAMVSLQTIDAEAESFIITTENRIELFDIINKVLSAGVVPETFEFIEKPIIELLQKNGKLDAYPQVFHKFIALIKYSGANIKIIEDIVTAQNGKIIRFEDKKIGNAIWDIRRDISQTLYGVGKIKINEDISVPIDTLNLFFEGLEKLKEQFNIYCFGHAGDGNIHVNIMVNDEKEKKVAEKALYDLFSLVVSLKGTITGEHGVGTSKRDYFHIEHSQNEIEVMKNIKRFVDKNALLNKDKIFEI